MSEIMWFVIGFTLTLAIISFADVMVVRYSVAK